jgi:hypothetical protein
MGMKLTSELLTTFIGGEIEIKSRRYNYIYHGKIKSLVIDELNITVGFEWIACGNNVEQPTQWKITSDTNYGMGIMFYTVIDIGPSSPGQDSRLQLHSDDVGETTTLFPVNGSKLDTSKFDRLLALSPKPERVSK